MKFLFKKILQVCGIFDSHSVHNFVTKAFLPLLFGVAFGFFTFSYAKSQIRQKPKGSLSELNQEGKKLSRKSHNSPSEKQDISQSSFFDKMRKKENLKARGVIVKFHRWPDSKQQKEIVRRLKASGLKKTKSIRNVQTWLFEWSKEDLKPSGFAQSACKKLKDLSHVKRCNPDQLLRLHYQKNKVFLNETKTYRVFNDSSTSFILAEAAQETEAGFIEHCTSCEEQNSISPVPLNIRTCNLLSCQKKSKREISCNHLMKGTLSDYWAQELIGSDLLREELKKASVPEVNNLIAVVDLDVINHMTRVKNLISNEGSHAVLPALKNEKILSTQAGFAGDYINLAEKLRKNPPHFINNSMSWGSRDRNDDIYEALERLSPPAVFVTAAGNEFPFETVDNTLKDKASRNFDAIVVGSFSPNGFASDFSNSGREVHIMAPSDHWLTSSDENGEYVKFSGTSGATPLVTGSLAGFEWLSGYHPTPEEAKVLLERTALPTLHSHEEPQINGKGLLNAYKLGEVGKRLKKKCSKKGPSCFKDEIVKEENYRFAVDESLKKDLGKIFPDCAIGKKPAVSLEIPSCKKKEEVFKRLRQAILLNPEESKEFLKSLSCIYKEGGFSQNAEALDNLTLALSSKEEVRASIRVLAEKQKKQNFFGTSFHVTRLMLGMGGFEKEFSSDENAIKIAGVMGEERGLPIIEKAYNTGLPHLQKPAVQAAGVLGEPGLPIIEKAYNTGLSHLQKPAVQAAGVLGEPGLPIVKKALEESYNSISNFQLQEVAVQAAGWIGEPAMPLLENFF